MGMCSLRRAVHSYACMSTESQMFVADWFLLGVSVCRVFFSFIGEVLALVRITIIKHVSIHIYKIHTSVQGKADSFSASRYFL